MVQPSLRFTLSFLEGCGVLQLEDRALEPAGRAERVALEIPGLRFPFDLSGGLQPFQSRHCRLRELVLSFSPGELATLVRLAPLADFGFHDPLLDLAQGGLRFAARVALGGGQADFTARVALQALGPNRLTLSWTDLRVYGFVPVPAPMLVAALFAALGAEDRGGTEARAKPRPYGRTGWASSLIRRVGSTDLEVSALDLSLFPLLAAHGWRLPERGDVALEALTVNAAGLQLRFNNQPEQSADEAEPEGPAERFVAAERALVDGDVAFALAAYRQAHLDAPEDPFVRERLLQLLASAPDRMEELSAVLGRRRGSDEPRPVELLSEALLAARRGQGIEAARAYLRLAEMAEAGGDTLNEACARRAAARQYASAGLGQAATAELERARARRPDHRGVRGALGERLSLEERWDDLLRLLTTQAAAESDPAARAALLSESGLLLLDRLGKEMPARERFEQALHLHREDAGAWEGIGRLRARAGDRPGAVAALEQAGRAYAETDRSEGQARIHAARGSLEQEAGAIESALEWFRRASELDPRAGDALHLEAELLGKMGRFPEAIARLEAALGPTREPAGRVRLLRRLALLERDGRRDWLAARRRLEEALQARPADAGALEDLARLLESSGEPAALEPFLRQAASETRPGEERKRIGRLCQKVGRQIESQGLLIEGLALLAEEGGREGALQALELTTLAERAENGPLLRRAADLLTRILATEPSGGDPLPITSLANRLAGLRLRQGDRTAAEALAHRVLGSYPDPDAATEAWKTIVRCALERGDVPAMRAGLSGWAEDARVTDTPEARATRLAEAGRLERDRLGSREGAAPLYERALALDPRNGAALLGLAEVAEERGEWPRLEEMLRRLLALPGPPHPQLRHRLGQVLMRRPSGVDEATRVYQSLLEQDPGDTQAALGRARCSWQLGALEASVAQFQKVVAAVEGKAGSEGGERVSWAAESHLRLAQSSRLHGEMAAANRHLQLALRREPGSGAPLDVLIEVFEAFGRTEELLACLERRRTAAPDPGAARKIGRALGGVLERVGRADDAVTVYRALLDAAPEDVESLFRLAEIFRREGRSQELVAPLEQLLDLAARGAAQDAPGLGTDIEAIGLELHALLDEVEEGSDKAEGVLRRILAVRPDSVEALSALHSRLLRQGGRAGEALTTLAQLYRQNLRSNLGRELSIPLAALAEGPGIDLALAISVLSEVVSQEPRDSVVANALLNLFQRLPREGDRLERLRDLQTRVSDLATGARVRIHTTLAAAAEERGDWATAEEELGRALACDTVPADRAAQLVARARVRILRGQGAGGEGDLRAAIQLVPDHAEALLQLADRAEAQAAWQEALELLDRVATTSKSEPLIAEERLAFRRAMAALRVGDSQRAEAGLEEVIALDPEHVQAREALVDVHLRRGNHEGARVQLERLTAAHPERALYWTALGELYDRLGLIRETADALGGLARALAEARPRAEALVRRGDLLAERLGDPGAAQYAYRLALDADPSFTSAAVRLLEMRWQAGELKVEALLDRLVEIAGQLHGDVGALDRAFGHLMDRNDDGSLDALRAALDARSRAPVDGGLPDGALAAVRQRLARPAGGNSHS